MTHQPVTHRLLSAAAVNAAANVTGAWYRAGTDWDKATVTYKGASTAGNVVMLLYIQAYYGDEAPVAATTDYVTINVGALDSASTAADNGTRYRMMPTEFLGRARWVRAYVDGQTGNNADATIDLWVTV